MGSIAPQDAPAPPAADGPRLIYATPAELNASRYDEANLQAALEALHQDGFVVLKGVVDVDHVDQISDYMNAEADELMKSNAKPFNQGVNSNILQGPPLKDDKYLHNDIFFNPFVIQLMNIYLGSKPIWNFLTGNNALPKTSGLRQPVHKDIIFYHPRCPFFVIANIPLCSFTPATGSTEFWLGSHAHTSGHDQIIATETDTLTNGRLRVGEPICNVRPEVVEERRKIRPPVQPVCGKGDVMLRDLRTWHAGMPNESDGYRIMLALGYQAQWYPNHTLRCKLPLSKGNFFMKHGGQPVEVRAELLPDDSDFQKLNDVFSFRHTNDY
ncbi:phytanoyl-dioxygenase family protein [Xylogone sp. PMI_703]|nr:phytanoyl-dioxygenase family protein [Xylogone sp. PMI_703]